MFRYLNPELSLASLQFRYLSSTSECLFSLINGDDMYNTFEAISSENVYAWWYSRMYLYVFISFFMYVVVNVFLSVIMDTYETIKVSAAVLRPDRFLPLTPPPPAAPRPAPYSTTARMATRDRTWSASRMSARTRLVVCLLRRRAAVATTTLPAGPSAPRASIRAYRFSDRGRPP